MKLLIIPENNSLSHIAKTLAIKKALDARGHKVHIAVGRKHANYVKQFGFPHHVLSDIQETNQSGFPTFDWFSSLINIETALLFSFSFRNIDGILKHSKLNTQREIK